MSEATPLDAINAAAEQVRQQLKLKAFDAEGAAHLANLEWLSLHGCDITDAGAKALARSPHFAKLRERGKQEADVKARAKAEQAKRKKPPLPKATRRAR